MLIMRVRDVGEFELIDTLAETLGGEDPGPHLRVAIGDDAAAWDGPAGVTVLTTDTMVEGVHFALDRTSWRGLGWKAMSVNLSDVAAMGCAPAYSVVTLGLHGDLPVDGLREMYLGMVDACRRFGGAVVGGDVVRSPVFFVTVAMTGGAEGGDTPLLLRGAARPGDRVAVTGSLGGSAGGLRMLAEGLAFDDETAAYLQNAHNRPAPRVREGTLLRQSGVLTAIDVSDGLVADLDKLCEASGVGAQVRSELLPVDDRLKAAFPQEWLSLALTGGEDYELLFTAPPRRMDAAVSALEIPATIIGDIVAGPGGASVLDPEGRPLTVKRGGWDHVREPSSADASGQAASGESEA